MTDFGAGSYHLDLKDPRTLEQLVHEYAQPLVRYACSFLGSTAAAEDAMEEAMAALLLHGGHFRSPEHLRAWLYKTTRNKAVDELRRHSRELPLENEQLLTDADAEQLLMKKQRDRHLYAGLRQLPVQYRDVLVLTYFDGFSVEQICHIQNKSAKQVYNLLSRGRVALRELLMKEGMTVEDL